MTTFQLIKKGIRETPIVLWFSRGWWGYLLEKADDKDYCSKWHRFWCRAAGHPEGPWFYNSCGFEPDWSCKSCGDELG